MSSLNQAAWVRKYGQPMEVGPSIELEPNSGEILIETFAVAINPVDWISQRGSFGTPTPFIVGEDVGGIIRKIGDEVRGLKVGDRVIALCDNFGVWDGRRSCFQNFCIANSIITFKIPETVEFTDATVLPLALFTAASGLFKPDNLGLELPNICTSKKENQVLLIWGAGSAVGHNGIQLANSSGYEVIVTCSPKSADTVTSLGATKWFDYHDKDVVDQIVEYLKGKHLIGVLNCVSFVKQQAEVIKKCESVSGKKSIAQVAMYPGPIDLGDGVSQKFVTFSDMEKIYSSLNESYLSNAIANGTYRFSPKSEIVGKGLESIQKALDIQQLSNSFSLTEGLIYNEKKASDSKENTKLVVIIKDEEE